MWSSVLAQKPYLRADHFKGGGSEDGYRLEWKGRPGKDGLVVGDAAGYSKFSALGLTISAKALVKRFGPMPKRSPRRNPPKAKVLAWASGRNLFAVDAVDVARMVGTDAELRQAVQEATGSRKARLAKASLTTQMETELKEAIRAATSLTPPRPTKSRRPDRSFQQRTHRTEGR